MSDFNAPRKEKDFFLSFLYKFHVVHYICRLQKVGSFLYSSSNCLWGSRPLCRAFCVSTISSACSLYMQACCVSTPFHIVAFLWHKPSSMTLHFCPLSLLKVRRELENVITHLETQHHIQFYCFFLLKCPDRIVSIFFQYESFRHEKCARIFSPPLCSHIFVI